MRVRMPMPKGQLREVVFDGTRFIVVVSGRRIGKTGQALRWLVKKALECQKRTWENWYIAPYYKDAREIVWLRLKEILAPELVKKFNENRLEIELINGNRIGLKGADNPSSLVGRAVNSAVFDEYGAMKAVTWEYLRPSFSDTNGSALFIGTPRGANHFKDLYYSALNGELPNFKSYPIFKTADSPFVPKEEVKIAKAQMDPRMFRQEYEGTFENYAGVVYSDFVNDWYPVGNLTTKIYNPSLPVYCGLDFGYNHNSCAIWMQYDKVTNEWIILPNAFISPKITADTLFGKILKGIPVKLGGYQEYVAPVPRNRLEDMARAVNPEDIGQFISGVEAHQQRQEANGSSMRIKAMEFGIELTTRSHRIFNSISNVRRFILDANGDRHLFVNPEGNKKLLNDFQSYHYPEDKDGNPIGEEPHKDGVVDDSMDALRYAIDTVTPYAKR